MVGNAFSFSSILVALAVLGVIIVIHELGHFLVAKFFKIKVETFSVGFGPRLFGFRRGETDYRVSAFPLGGYVKMAGETPGDTITGEPYEFLSKPKWQRFLVAVAGPAMNIVLAVGLLTGLYVYGTDVPEFFNGEALIGAVEPGSPADRAGIKPGDMIVSLDGKEKPNWQDVQNSILINPGRALPIVVTRGGEKLELEVTPDRRGREESGYVGMGPVIRTVVRKVNPGSPAEKAGVKPGDEIIRVNGVDLKATGRSIQQAIQDVTQETVPLVVLREREEIELQVAPTVTDGKKMIGIEILFPTIQIKLGLLDAFSRSIDQNKENALLIFDVIGKLVKREASLKQLDGPIGIVNVAGQASQAGMATLIMLISLISLNLGVLNLLPIPILDGGVIMLLLIEAVMGRDISLRMKERIVQVSFVFLLMLTVIVLYNDVVKLLPAQ